MTKYLWGFIFIIFLSSIVAFYSYQSHCTISVKVNGRTIKVSREANLKQALKISGTSLMGGDLLDIQDRILKKGGGKTPVILLNEKIPSLYQKIQESDAITVYPGENLKERVLKKFEIIHPPFTLNGWGTFLSIQPGRPGLKEITFGEKSGLLLEEKLIKQPIETKIIKYSKSSRKVVALTFDDGPYFPYTSQILNILKDKQAPATFFVVGKHIEDYPKVLAEVAASGHAIGNHTYSHVCLPQAPYKQIVQELERNENLIVKNTGKKPHWFRPPGGNLSPSLIDIATDKGYHFALWNVDSEDWNDAPPEYIQHKVFEEVVPGAVILLHDGGGVRSATVAALPGIIDNLRAQGFSFVSLDEIYNSREILSGY